MTAIKSYFVAAEIVFNGKTYRLKKSVLDKWVSRGDYWHGPAVPSTWLCEKAVRAVRAKFKSLPQSAVLELVALSMEITVEKLVAAIQWNEAYMSYR